MAPAKPSAQSSFFHPQHLVVSYHYDGSSTYDDCAVCKRIITGTGYGCDECDFHNHEACFSLPESIAVDQHPEHKLTLTRLAASRCCDVCKDTSHERRYLYRCVPCSFDVHPHCTSDGAQPRQPPPPPPGGRPNGSSRVLKYGVKAGFFGLITMADMATTGGSLSLAIAVIGMGFDKYLI